MITLIRKTAKKRSVQIHTNGYKYNYLKGLYYVNKFI